VRSENERFQDEGDLVYEFLEDEILVRCPQCGRRARLVVWGEGDPELMSPRRLACHFCGFTRDHHDKALSIYRDGRDPCFGNPLWLRSETPKGIVWAYNMRHLTLLHSYIQAQVRERHRMVTWSNRSIYSRLPRWMKSSKNRELVLRHLEKLATSETGIS